MSFDKLHICETTATIKIEYFLTSKSLLAPLRRLSSLHACVQVTTALLSLQTSLHCLEFCINGIMQHILCCAWLLSFSTVILRFILVAYTVAHPFPDPLYECAIFYLSICLLMDIWVGYSLWLLWAWLLVTFVEVFVWTFGFVSLDKYLEVEQLGHMVRLCFLRHCQTVFQSNCSSFHLHQPCMRVPVALHFFNTWDCHSL